MRVVFCIYQIILKSNHNLNIPSQQPIVESPSTGYYIYPYSAGPHILVRLRSNISNQDDFFYHPTPINRQVIHSGGPNPLVVKTAPLIRSGL